MANLKSKLGPINWQLAETKKFDQEDFEAFLALLPKDLRHTVEARHESFKCSEFVDLARKYQVAIVLAGDSRHPLIPDITASFTYARIMGTTEEHDKGYSEAQLDKWATRFQALAAGKSPEELQTVSPAVTQNAGRNVFVYVIGGFKQSNPAAAMSLIEKVRS